MLTQERTSTIMARVLREKYCSCSLLTQDLVEILYSDAGTKAVLSVWELLLEWQLDSNSKCNNRINL